MIAFACTCRIWKSTANVPDCLGCCCEAALPVTIMDIDPECPEHGHLFTEEYCCFEDPEESD